MTNHNSQFSYKYTLLEGYYTLASKKTRRYPGFLQPEQHSSIKWHDHTGI